MFKIKNNKLKMEIYVYYLWLYDIIIIGGDSMASSVIHMIVANEINKKIKRDNDKVLIGSIAPDISKCIGKSKVESHFLDNNCDIPNIDSFLKKYNSKLDDDFVIGYFIHLYTDYLWSKYFIPEVYKQDMITKLDRTIIKCNDNMFNMYIYNDYTNLNIRLLDEYDIDLKIFYNSPPKLENIIEEIPMEDIQIILDKTSVIIENTKINKDLVFDIKNIKKFISTSVNLILAVLKQLNFKEIR